MPYGLPVLSSGILSTIETVAQDAVSLSSFLFPLPSPVYGIFSSGGYEALTGYSSVIGQSYQADEQLPTYPVEQGGFNTYNKVAMPWSGKLTYVVTGGDQYLNIFLAQCEALRQDTNLYTLVTPAYSWPNGNVTHYDFKRDAQHGFSMLTVDVWISEVRQAMAAQFSQSGTAPSPTNTQSPDGQAQVNGGTVQPQPGALAGSSNSAQIYAQIAGENVTPPPS